MSLCLNMRATFRIVHTVAPGSYSVRFHHSEVVTENQRAGSGLLIASK